MGASPLVTRAKSLKIGLVLMMPRAARVSATTEREAPAGTRTRIGSPDGVPEHAATTHVNASTVATRGLLTNPPIEVGLEDEERRGGIDSALLLALGFFQPQLTHSFFRSHRRHPFVDEFHGYTGTLCEFCAEVADLPRPIALVAGQGQGEPDDDPGNLLLLHDL